MTDTLNRCLSCQAFLGADVQDDGGYRCPACRDEWPGADLEGNELTFDSERGVWVYVE